MQERYSLYLKTGGILGGFFLYFIQHCFICRPSDPTVLKEAGVELSVSIFKLLRSTINYRLAGWYDNNPIPTRFLAPD
jgi:hypothetical protein